MPPRGSGWVKKPDYASIRKQLIKCKCIDDNTGFMIINNNQIMIVFQDFKQLFNLRSKDNIFSLKKLYLNGRNFDQLELLLLCQLTNLTELDLSKNIIFVLYIKIIKNQIRYNPLVVSIHKKRIFSTKVQGVNFLIT